MENIDKLNLLFDKHKDKVIGAFHTVLWQILINHARKTEGKNSALVYLYAGNDRVGIADRGHAGYTPVPFSFDEKVSVEDRLAVITDLNKEIFGLTDVEAFEIVATSMRKTNSY